MPAVFIQKDPNRFLTPQIRKPVFYVTADSLVKISSSRRDGRKDIKNHQRMPITRMCILWVDQQSDAATAT